MHGLKKSRNALGFRVLGFGFWVLDFGFWVSGLGKMVGCRVWSVFGPAPLCQWELRVGASN